MQTAFSTRSLGATRMGLTFQNPKWRYLVAVACLAVLAVGIFRLVRPQPYQAEDFGIYYNAALAIREGANPYAPAVAWVRSFSPGGDLEPYLMPTDAGTTVAVQDGQAGLTDRARLDYLANRGRVFLYGPAFALLVVPLTFVPFQVATLLWQACILVFLAGAIYTLLRFTAVQASALTALLLVTLGLIMPAMRGELFLGQANLFTVACICAALLLRLKQRVALAALILGLAFVTKPALLLFVVFLLWKREFRFALASSGAFLVLLLAPFLWLGSAILNDLLNVWRFSSAHSSLWEHNVGLRGVLDRLLTANPFVSPLVEAPSLVSIIWLFLVAIVLLLSLAVVGPHPLRRDRQSLLEIGLMSTVLLLISPLTETPYHVFLIVPWVALFVFLRGAGWTQPRFAWTSVGLLGLWLFELFGVPLVARLFIWLRLPVPASIDNVAITLAPTLFIAIAAFALQVHALGLVSGSPPSQMIRQFVRHLPWLAGDWLRDVAAWRRWC